MDFIKLKKIIEKKYPNFEFLDKPDELFYNDYQNIVAHYRITNDYDNRNAVFFIIGTKIMNVEFFENYFDARDYFGECVKVL